MPPRPLLDLSRFDLSRPQYGRDDIRKLIPHRGAMAHLDAIVHIDRREKFAVGYKDVRADEFWTEGHFPGNPILPGVVMIEAAGQLAICGYMLTFPELGDKLVVFGGVDEVRFRGVVRPGDRVLLVARDEGSTSRMARCRTQAIVDGKVVFEGLVLGIPTDARAH